MLAIDTQSSAVKLEIWVVFMGSIRGSEPTSRRRQTWFEPMGDDALAAGDHHLTLY